MVSLAEKTHLESLISTAKGTGSTGKQALPEPGDYGRIKAFVRQKGILEGKTPDQIEREVVNHMEDEIKRTKQDALLYGFGPKLSISSQYFFPRYYNGSANTPEVKGLIFVERPFWLGKGSGMRFSKYNYKKATPDQLAKFISTTLIDQIVEMALMYAKEPETTPRDQQIHAQQTGKQIERKFYVASFDLSFGESSYTHKLVTGLADWINQGFPSDFAFPEIPEYADYLRWGTRPVLLKHEYEEIKRKLREGDHELPEQIREKEAINNENSLKEEIAFLRSQLEEKNKNPLQDELEGLRKLYREKFGKPAPHNARFETLQERLSENTETPKTET